MGKTYKIVAIYKDNIGDIYKIQEVSSSRILFGGNHWNVLYDDGTVMKTDFSSFDRAYYHLERKVGAIVQL